MFNKKATLIFQQEQRQSNASYGSFESRRYET